MRGAGRIVSFDPNLRPTLWATPELMREAINDLAMRADWVLPGLEEGRFLAGETSPESIARYYRQRGAKLVVVKLGSAGAYFDGETGSVMSLAFPWPRWWTWWVPGTVLLWVSSARCRTH